MINLDLDAGPVISTQLLIEHLSAERDERLQREVEDLILQRLVDTRACDWCGAGYAEWCRVYGGYSTLRRTHPVRLRLKRRERLLLVGWALRRHRIAAPGEDLEESA